MKPASLSPPTLWTTLLLVTLALLTPCRSVGITSPYRKHMGLGCDGGDLVDCVSFAYSPGPNTTTTILADFVHQNVTNATYYPVNSQVGCYIGLNPSDSPGMCITLYASGATGAQVKEAMQRIVQKGCKNCAYAPFDPKRNDIHDGALEIRVFPYQDVDHAVQFGPYFFPDNGSSSSADSSSGGGGGGGGDDK
ncbi:MAG: hypothetical protein M1838_000708 [Thelocarpon superellum]|nr:MAG: hypothetical protein M1838_000708 [Thelocarpon superellum]